MNYNIVILSEAELDIDDAFIWYEMNQIGLVRNFMLQWIGLFTLYPKDRLAVLRFIKVCGGL